MFSEEQVDKNNLPKSVAFIIDGNGRWAKNKGMPRLYGHKAGIKAVENTIKNARELGIKELTFFCFSTENWNRPKAEVDGLFNLFREHLKNNDYEKENIKFVFCGKKDELSADIVEMATKLEEKTKNCNEMTVCLCINYGGRYDIVQAVNNIIASGKKSVSQEEFSKYLLTKDISEPDLVVRTGGELRISNFLLYQLAYSELYFTKTSWPDFNKNELYEAIIEFQKRNRRFGSIKEWYMFWKRALTGIVIVLVTIGFFALRLISPYFFDGYLGVITLFAVYEICRVHEKAQKKVDLYVLLLYPVLCYIALLLTLLNNLSIWIFLAIIFCIAVVLFAFCFIFNKVSKARINREMVENQAKMTYNNYVKSKSLRDLFLLAYPTLPLLSLFVLNHFASFAKTSGENASNIATFLLVLVFVTTMLTDTVAYLVGSGIGGKKLCPKISPNKTISGAIGGLIGSILGATLLFFIFSTNDGYRAMFNGYQISIITCLVIGIVASIFAQLGDIFASFIKRKNDAKDYGKIVVGHGGVLDRVDGLIINSLIIMVLALILF